MRLYRRRVDARCVARTGTLTHEELRNGPLRRLLLSRAGPLCHDRRGGKTRIRHMRRLLAVLLLALLSTPTFAAQCGGDFQTFLAQISREAQAQGVSGAVISQAFASVSVDPNVLSFDRRQRGTFRKTFEEYAATRVTQGRITRGRQLLQRHAALLSRVEQQFGPPKEMIVAIWGLESDYGSGDMGKLPVVRTIATLAHDCRRTELFQRELIAALKILQRGDLTLQGMVGAYAGELGQTQFLPSSYIKYGVDYDGNGHVDLRRSVPDVLASTANLLKVNGWQRGASYQEGSANFQVMREWNRSEVYRKTIALFTDRLTGR
jgi:lytic murein transglycosylase